MHRHRLGWLSALAALALVVLSWHAPAALAADGTGAGHCVVGLVGVQEGAVPTSESVEEVRCFATFAEAVEYASDGRVTVEPGATTVPEAELRQSDAISTEAEKVARPLLGIEYRNSSYGGDSLVLYGASGTGCYAGTTYGFSSMASYGFNDRISSAKMYSNCFGKHFAGSSFTGDTFYCYSNCPGFGSMNDRTSSIRYF